VLVSNPKRPERIWFDLVGLIALLAAVFALAFGPTSAALLHRGRGVTASETVTGWWRMAEHDRWERPARAFPRRARRLLPAPAAFWTSVGGVFVITVVASTLVARRVDRLMATPRLGRRRLGVRGARPRSWARPRDLSALACRRDRARLRLGTIGRRRVLLAAQEELNLLLVAPTRAGKTSRFVVPWTLEAPGPCISLSVKRDVFRITGGHRSRLGRVWVWDPFGPRSAGWSPLLGCDDWGAALRRATHLADAGGKGRESEAAAFWNAEGAKLLAPLLHAAAIKQAQMSTVLRWLDERADEEPMTILDAADAAPAAAQLDAVLGLDPRNAGTTYISAANLLEAYRHPEVQGTESTADFSAGAFLDGEPNTLYVVAGPDEQQLLAPIVVALIGEILGLAAARANATGKGLHPTLRVVGDELPNIAPIRSLPRYVATLLDAGVRFACVCQDLAQLETTYGTAKDTILSNSQVKLFLGPVTCPRTRRYITDLLGDEPVIARTLNRGGRGYTTESVTWRARASAQLLQQLEAGRTLLLHTNAPAAVIDTRPWWEIPSIRNICELSLDGKGTEA
jgi:type IV secretion system protein VirD4